MRPQLVSISNPRFVIDLDDVSTPLEYSINRPEMVVSEVTGKPKITSIMPLCPYHKVCMDHASYNDDCGQGTLPTTVKLSGVWLRKENDRLRWSK
ncbi:hypothetical protein ACTXT7_004511 [Hymenolepis weldensis]